MHGANHPHPHNGCRQCSSGLENFGNHLQGHRPSQSSETPEPSPWVWKPQDVGCKVGGPVPDLSYEYPKPVLVLQWGFGYKDDSGEGSSILDQEVCNDHHCHRRIEGSDTVDSGWVNWFPAVKRIPTQLRRCVLGKCFSTQASMGRVRGSGGQGRGKRGRESPHTKDHSAYEEIGHAEQNFQGRRGRGNVTHPICDTIFF